MKKLIISLTVSIILGIFAPVFSDDFSYLEDLTPVQKQKLGQVYHSYKQNVNSLDMRIGAYKDKINQINSQTDKTVEQVTLLVSAYERNVKVLNSQKEQLKKQLETQYKSIMTADQYKQYLAQQMQAQNAFNEFLRK